MRNFDVEFCKNYVGKNFEESVIPSLMDYVRIPNLSRSYDKEWETNNRLDEAALHIKKWVGGLGIKGLKTEVIKDEGYSPLIFTEV